MLKLTVIETVLTEAAEEKVINHYKEIESSGGLEKEDEWDRMGIERPAWAEKKQQPQDPDLQDEDFINLEKTVYVDALEIVMVEQLDDEETGSKVYLKSQYTVTVKESPEEIANLKKEYLAIT